MTTAIEVRDDEKPAASRWRRFSAVAGVAALAAASTVIAASPASASESCGTYHNWTECIRYSGGVLAVSAHNGYSSGYTENLWLNNYSFDGIYIPSGQWSAWYGYTVPTGPVYACAGIDSVQIICAGL